ncbi:anti-sigma-D factor RsdA [Haloechinothrix sp. LS1_15]|uniref:anti-sigma-D factor RsdA n=1 Tax=Haloechinothrix sp. LS1_15 TaxID=2652248 RepID=UPI00294AEB42|nr:anti-sigma-D factor RsdA [Haloechinothrix sp. LS1_15]
MPERDWDEWERELDDIAQVHADDALLDALGGADPSESDQLGEAELNALLLSWRREVDSQPVPELVDSDTAVRTVAAANLARRHGDRARRWKFLVPVAAAASVLGIAFAGAGIAAKDAQPGDTLWGVTKVLYADKARSIEAATEVRHEFNLARTALSRGQLEDARSALEEAQVALDSVHIEEDRAELTEQHRELMTRLDEGNGSSGEGGTDGDSAGGAEGTTSPEGRTSSPATSKDKDATSATTSPTTSPDGTPTETDDATTSPSPTPSDDKDEPTGDTTERKYNSDSGGSDDDSNGSESSDDE